MALPTAEGTGRQTTMLNDKRDPRDWRDVRVLRAQGVLAEQLGISLHRADRCLRAHAAWTGLQPWTVAEQVCDGELILDAHTCDDLTLTSEYDSRHGHHP